MATRWVLAGVAAVAFAALLASMPAAAVAQDAGASAAPEAASATCVPEHQPDDRPENATPVSGAFCADGSMSTSEQHILAWTIDADAAKRPWTIHIDGPLGVQSKLQIYHLDEPGDANNPAVVGPELLALATTGDNNVAELSNVFLVPGTFLVGLSSSSDAPGNYHVSATTGDAPPATPTANSTADSAAPVAAAFAANGTITAKEVWYTWTLGAPDALRQWTLTAAAPLGAPVGLQLQTKDGKSLLSVTRLTAGRLVLPDIGLPAGSYRIRLAADADGAFPFALSAVAEGPRSPVREDEPNDTPLTARPLAIGQAMVGHISQAADIDTFVVPVNGIDGKLFTVSLGGDSKETKRVCVGSADGALAQCHDGVTPSLEDIKISDATRFVTVSGSPSPGASYELTVRASGTAAPDGEAEPNDTAQQANALAAPKMHGRFVGDDTDDFSFVVDDTKTRSFELTGDGATALDVLDTQGQSSGRLERSKDAGGQPVPGPLDLSGLALPPGNYFVSVTGKDSDYTLASSVTDAPPPASNTVAEREPNDNTDEEQPLRDGETIKGSLKDYNDPDIYRLSLATRQGVDIQFAPTTDCPAGSYVAAFEWDSDNGQFPRISAPSGQVADYKAVLEPGDYTLSIRSQLCEQPVDYTLSYKATLDTEAVGDVEPNDTVETARPLQSDLTVSGTVGQFDDPDWFRLPTVSADTPVKVTATGQVSLSVTDGVPTSSITTAQPTELSSGDSSGPVVATIPAGDAGAIKVTGTGDYTLKVEMQGVAATPVVAANAAALQAKLTLDSSAVAAYWARGQEITGKVALTNTGATALDATLSGSATTPGWSFTFPDKVSVPANGSQTVPVTIDIAPDPFATKAVGLTVTAAAGTTASASADAQIAVDANAPAVGDHLAYTLPTSLLGGFDVAWTALGGQLQLTDQIKAGDTPEAINDGLAGNAGFRIDAGSLPLTFTINFAGDRAWPIRGMTLSAQSPNLWPTEYVKNFELWLSPDGQNFQKVLTGELKPDPTEQAFVLPAPMMARAAQLRVISNGNANTGHVGFSEWKVITDPSAGIGSELDIADDARGGHIVWSDPLISPDTPDVHGVLEAGGDGPIVKGVSGMTPQITLGFNDDRTAQITHIDWTDSPAREDAGLFTTLHIDVSTETPLGPWTSLGDWTLQRDANGHATKSFDQPVWARFVRLSGTQPMTDGEKLQYPTEISVYERASDANYRSILGEWGQYSPNSFYELTQPAPPPARIETADHQTRETADPLALGELASGRVEIGRREDWYKVDQPADQDLMTITLGGEPTVGTEVTLWDDANKNVQVSQGTSSPRSIAWEAHVTPGKSYYLRVVQPPHSVVVAYDTSGSLLQFIPMIANALEVFAEGVTPGQESVNFLPFDSHTMLPNFSDQPQVLEQALAKDPRTSTTSGLEGTAITAMQALAQRAGTRALLVVTDAATSTAAASTEMWKMIGEVQPRIFAAHTGSYDDPLQEKERMEDLALANGGHYASSRSQPELDVAFDRLAAWLRRPADYTIKVEAGKAAPPEPGAITVIAGADTTAGNTETGASPQSTRQTVEIVLDASGSMLAHFGTKRKIEIAHDALDKLVTTELKPGDPVALRVFGNDKPGSCATSLMTPLSPLNPDAMTQAVNGIIPQNLARTPIAASLAQVPSDLTAATGQKVVVLITDGEETCGGDPRAAIAALAASDIAVRLNIVGFEVDDDQTRAEFAEWVRLGRGQYFDVTKPEQLDEAVKAATQMAYSIKDATGVVVGNGTVGGPPVPLPAGTYRVEIAGTPARVFESVVVKEKQTTQLEADGQ